MKGYKHLYPHSEAHRKNLSLSRRGLPFTRQTRDEVNRRNRERRPQEKTFARSLRMNHNMTVAEYDAMWLGQSGRCKICDATLVRGGKGNTDVDHDHVTGVVRALLCHPCNTMIGFAHESALVLRSAAIYLETFRC